MTPESWDEALPMMLAEKAKTGSIDYKRWAKGLGTTPGALKVRVFRATKSDPEVVTRAVTAPVTVQRNGVTRGADIAKAGPDRAERDIPDGLTPQQWRAMALRLAGKTTRETADEIGVSRSTFDRWATLPAWKVAWAVEETRDKMETRDVLRSNSVNAARGLVGVIDNSEAPASAIVAASIATLEFNGHSRKQSLEVSGPDGGPVIVAQLQTLTDREIHVLSVVPDYLLEAIDSGAYERDWLPVLIPAGLVPNVIDAEETTP